MGDSPGLFTIGYEALRIDQFVNKLRESRIDTLVDVRLTASSRRPGFSKTALGSALAGAGIRYIHERDLGNPPTNRDAFRRGRLEEGRRLMRSRLENGSAEALQRLVERANHERTAIMCVEAADARCHRQVIVEMVREVDPRLRTASIW
ncbi:MAG: DUF488 domain-containing protein [Acidimicrobiales bacterium]|jgi:uncharacterized protein (DUF488 family)